MRRVFDAAAMLGVDAVCGFVGRNQARSMDQNLLDFEEHFVPLLKEALAWGADVNNINVLSCDYLFPGSCVFLPAKSLGGFFDFLLYVRRRLS